MLTGAKTKFKAFVKQLAHGADAAAQTGVGRWAMY